MCYASGAAGSLAPSRRVRASAYRKTACGPAAPKIIHPVQGRRLSHYIMLTLRPTGLSPPIYHDQLDYEVIEDGRAVGRMYEDKHALPELRWFWSITVFVGYRPGVTTSGRAATLEEAKARFLSNWQKCRTNSTPMDLPSI